MQLPAGRRPSKRGSRRRLAGLAVIASWLVVAAALPLGSHATAQPRSTPVARKAADPAQVLVSQLRAAVSATKYPAALAPSPGLGKSPYLVDNVCFGNPDPLNTSCMLGPADAPKLAVIIGDSVSASFIDAALAVLPARGYRVHAMSYPGCPVALVRVKLSFSPEAADHCNNFKLLFYAQVQRLHPDLVIAVDSASGLQRLASGNRGAAAEAEWLHGERQALALMSGPGRRIVTFGPNPVSASPPECYTPGSSPQACAHTIDPWWFAKRRAETTAAADLGTEYIDTESWFSYDHQVAMFAGTTTQRWDGSHITKAYAARIAPLMRKALFGTY